MGLCGSSEATETDKRSVSIDAQLRKDFKEERAVVKLLLLGILLFNHFYYVFPTCRRIRVWQKYDVETDEVRNQITIIYN
jgi:hypothetical protein